ncbi:MAG: ABC transporter permease, partial [Bacteriovoracaceae bacterium]|nr:ABC transporter permease [Bacteriovoracaceae bacterium]
MRLKSNLLKVYTLTWADMKGRYRNTFAGFLWVMFNPLIMFGVHSLVFKHILKLDIDRYFVFLLAGLLPWIFITSTIQTTANTFLTMRDVLMSFQINPLILLFSKLLDNFINFIIPFICLFIFVTINEGIPLEGIWYLPLNLTLMLAMTLSLNVLVSTLQVFFRDVQYVVQFGFSILYFLTPIFYPESLVPQQYQWIMKLNPIYAVIKPFQKSLWKFDQVQLNEAILNAL